MRRWFLLAWLMCAALTSCMRWDYVEVEELEASAEGLFITNEGNFQYGNATLSFYDPATDQVQGEVFYRANGFKLGDVAQSMVVHGGKGWIVVNNSHVVFAINADNFKEVGRIENLPAPRYMHFVSDDKAYISQLWDNRIFIVDPNRYKVIGAIEVPGMAMESGSTEQMVQLGSYVYANCWSYQNRIIKIDTETDQVVGSLTVGIQPRSIALDCNGKLWTLCDGGYQESAYGHEIPSLYRIDAEKFEIEAFWQFNSGDSPHALQLNGAGDTLYYINGDVWRMSVDSNALPKEPFIASRGTIYYGLTVDPVRGDVYVADAIDYQQPGMIYRYNVSGSLIDEFYVGIIPGAFAWKVGK